MLDEKLLQERLNQFKPEPLVDYKHDPNKVYEIPAVLEGVNAIDLAKTNFLNILNNDEIKRTAEATIRKYGVGTCGPRGFYGTTDVHLELEEKLAEFLGVDDCIIYPYGFVTISSAIAAYATKNDVIFIDKEANEAILFGLRTSKSHIVYFDHQDPDSFRKEAEKFATSETKKKRRKFLILEGISWRTGKLCPLPKFIQTAEEFKMRIFVDETYTLGVLGRTGKGLTEYYDLSIDRIDMSFGTIEGALGSMGGYCAGSQVVIEHQRLAGSGYIFSASLPTYLVQIAIKSLEILDDKPRKLVKLSREFHRFLDTKCGFKVISHPVSPFKVFTAIDEKCLDAEEKIHRLCAEEGVHFQRGEKGLVINLNVALYKNSEKMGKVQAALMKASELVVKGH